MYTPVVKQGTIMEQHLVGMKLTQSKALLGIL